MGAQQGDNVSTALRFEQQAARCKILLEGAMPKSENAVATLDEQTGSLAQVTNHPFALIFDHVPIECHLVSQKLLHEVIHLMLAAGHEEAPALREQRSGADWEAVERFAESAASHALVPEAALRWT